MQPRSLLTRELMRPSGGGEGHRARAAALSGEARPAVDARAPLPPAIAAELHAILHGQLGGDDACSGLKVFGTSPPPRECTNALVRDAGFVTMRSARPTSTGASSCATAWHHANNGASGDSSASCGGLQAYLSSPTSALGSAAA